MLTVEMHLLGDHCLSQSLERPVRAAIFPPPLEVFQSHGPGDWQRDEARGGEDVAAAGRHHLFPTSCPGPW